MISREHNLTEGPIYRRIAAFALPILLSNLLQQMYNSVDSLILGRFAGESALAASGSVGALLNLLIGFSLGLATGVNVLHALRFGEGDQPGMRRLVDNALILAVLAAAAVTALGAAFADGLLALMHIPGEVLGDARKYLLIVLAGALSTLLYNVGAGVVRGEGDSLFPLLCLALGGAVNLVLDYILVALAGLGIGGAAWATVAAQTLTAVMILFRLTRLDARHALRPGRIAFHRATARELIRVSLPCGLQSSTFGISNFIIQTRINTFGAVVMAGCTAYTKIDAFVYMPCIALSAAASTFVGQNMGAGRTERLRSGIRACIGIAMGTTALLAGTILLLIRPLMGLFSPVPQVIEAGAEMARCLLPFVWFYPISDVLGGAVRGGGQSLPPTLISILCICLLRVVWLWVFPASLGTRIVYYCYPVSWWLSCFGILWYYFRRSEVRRRVIGAGA